MKLKFDPSLEYQQQAIDAIVGVFAGQSIVQSHFEINAATDDGMQLSDLGVGNRITLTDEQLLANVQGDSGDQWYRKAICTAGTQFFDRDGDRYRQDIRLSAHHLRAIQELGFQEIHCRGAQCGHP